MNYTNYLKVRVKIKITYDSSYESIVGSTCRISRNQHFLSVRVDFFRSPLKPIYPMCFFTADRGSFFRDLFFCQIQFSHVLGKTNILQY